MQRTIVLKTFFCFVVTFFLPSFHLLSFASNPDNSAAKISVATKKNSTKIDVELKEHLQKALNSVPSFKDRFDAEVWLLSMSKPMSRFINNHEERLALLKMVHREASQQQLQPEIVLAVIEIESRFDRFAISRVGAQGFMQVMPFWKEELGRTTDNLTDIKTNLRYGCAILKYYLDKENGELKPALARYNGSYGKTWYSNKVLKAWNQYWRHGSLDTAL